MNNQGILLDTHVWLWLMSGDDAISKRAQKIIDAACKDQMIFISIFSIWELAMLDAKDRIRLDMPIDEWINYSLSETPIRDLVMTSKIAVESTSLPGDFHGDPADRIITATARVENLLLLTKDKKILTYSKSKYVNTLEV